MDARRGPERTRALGLALLAVISSTGLVLLLRGTMEVWPVGQAGLLSRLGSIALLGLWVGTRGRRWQRLAPDGAGGWLVLMGAISILINICWFAGMQWTSVASASVVLRLDLLFVLLIGATLGMERLSAGAWIIVPVMMLGLALLMEIHRLDWAGHALGDALILVAAFGLAANAFVIRHILRRMDVEAVALYNHVFSGVGFGVLMLIQSVDLPASVRAEPVQWLWIVALAVTAAVSLPLYYAALRRMAIWKLRVLMLLGPAIGAAAEWVLWGQALHAGQWTGAALIVAGAAALVLIEQAVTTERNRVDGAALPQWIARVREGRVFR